MPTQPSKLPVWWADPLLLINGYMTLPFAIVIAHTLNQLFANVAVFVPKLSRYLVVSNHSGRHTIGDPLAGP